MANHPAQSAPFGSILAGQMAVAEYHDGAWGAFEVRPVAPLPLQGKRSSYLLLNLLRYTDKQQAEVSDALPRTLQGLLLLILKPLALYYVLYLVRGPEYLTC